MHCAKLAIAVALLTSCAAQSLTVVDPVRYASTMPVDFDEIPFDRCQPALEGMFLSHEGAIDLVRGMRKVERDYQVQLINQETQLRVCQTKFEASQEELAQNEANKTWAAVGKIGTGVVTAIVVTGTVVLLVGALRK